MLAYLSLHDNLLSGTLPPIEAEEFSELCE